MNHYIISVNYKLLTENYKYFILKKIRLISINSSALLSIHLLRLILIAELNQNSFVSTIVLFKRINILRVFDYIIYNLKLRIL